MRRVAALVAAIGVLGLMSAEPARSDDVNELTSTAIPAGPLLPGEGITLPALPEVDLDLASVFIDPLIDPVAAAEAALEAITFEMALSGGFYYDTDGAYRCKTAFFHPAQFGNGMASSDEDPKGILSEAEATADWEKTSTRVRASAYARAQAATFGTSTARAAAKSGITFRNVGSSLDIAVRMPYKYNVRSESQASAPYETVLGIVLPFAPGLEAEGKARGYWHWGWDINGTVNERGRVDFKGSRSGTEVGFHQGSRSESGSGELSYATTRFRTNDRLNFWQGVSLVSDASASGVNTHGWGKFETNPYAEVFGAYVTIETPDKYWPCSSG